MKGRAAAEESSWAPAQDLHHCMNDGSMRVTKGSKSARCMREGRHCDSTSSLHNGNSRKAAHHHQTDL